MITIFLIVLFAACSAFVLIEYIRWQDWNIDLGLLETNLFDRKPFNCHGCLSGWISVLTTLVMGFGWYSILFLPICIVAGFTLEILLKKLL